MSLISDDRYLNEINIPGTHDAAMAGVEGGTILLELGYEYNSGDEARTYEKAQRHLNIYENRINPSTSKNTGALGYGINYSAGNGYNVNGSVAGKPFSYENHYEADAGHKLEYVQKFFNGGTIEEWPAGASTKAYRKKTIYPQIR